jgi:integrase
MVDKITQQLRSKTGANSKPSFPKTDSRYWKTRLRKTTNSRGEESPNWSMPICFKGRRLTFSLRTPNKDAAAIEARNIYNDLVSLGIEKTLAKYRPDAPQKAEKPASIGEWIQAASEVFDGRPATFGGYTRALRLIAGDILSVEKTKRRFAAKNRSEYRSKIEGAPLSTLTPQAIQSWRIRFVAKAAKNPERERRSKISCNSLIRQARALFSDKILKFVAAVKCPEPVPFAGCEMYPRESMRYHSKIDPETLLKSARMSLAESDPEACVALFLAIGAGLRRNEIDKLLWRQVDLGAGEIRIEATEAGSLKSEDSAGVVSIDAGLAGILRLHRSKSGGDFVIVGDGGETESKFWGQRYRCNAVFKRVNTWLRNNGVNANKPLHTLRKEAGSLIATKSGIHAASRFLRHADIQVTAMHYADHKERVTVGIGSFLEAQNVTGLEQSVSEARERPSKINRQSSR